SGVPEVPASDKTTTVEVPGGKVPLAFKLNSGPVEPLRVTVDPRAFSVPPAAILMAPELKVSFEAVVSSVAVALVVLVIVVVPVTEVVPPRFTVKAKA